MIARALPPASPRLLLAPTLDVLLFLLVTLVLFALSLNHHDRGGPVLAGALTGSDDGDTLVTIEVTRAGEYFRPNGEGARERISLAEIAAIQVMSHAGSPDGVLVRADRDAEFRDAAAAFRAVRASGATRLWIETRPKSPTD